MLIKSLGVKLIDRIGNFTLQFNKKVESGEMQAV